jgi:hypothetical protein
MGGACNTYLRTCLHTELRCLDLFVTLILAVGPSFAILFGAFSILCFGWPSRSVSPALWASKHRFWGISFPLTPAKLSWLINLCVCGVVVPEISNSTVPYYFVLLFRVIIFITVIVKLLLYCGTFNFCYVNV